MPSLGSFSPAAQTLGGSWDIRYFDFSEDSDYGDFLADVRSIFVGTTADGVSYYSSSSYENP